MHISRFLFTVGALQSGQAKIGIGDTFQARNFQVSNFAECDAIGKVVGSGINNVNCRGLLGSYVAVYVALNIWLAICEVEVFGYKGDNM